MKDIQTLIQHVAPTLASALGGPFSGVATKFIKDNLVDNNVSDGRGSQELIADLLNDSKNLKKIKDLDNQFKLDMQKLDVDVFSLEITDKDDVRGLAKTKHSPQVIISALFLVAYFLMLASIFFVEVSDTLNMEQGDNSLMGELQILFGVLTAGVGQILSYWFGGVLGKKETAPN